MRSGWTRRAPVVAVPFRSGGGAPPVELRPIPALPSAAGGRRTGSVGRLLLAAGGLHFGRPLRQHRGHRAVFMLRHHLPRGDDRDLAVDQRRRPTTGSAHLDLIVCADCKGPGGGVVTPTSLRRWVEQFEAHGLSGLVRQQRTDRGLRRALLSIPSRYGATPDAVEQVIGETLLTARGRAAAVYEALSETWPKARWNRKTVQRWVRLWKAENAHLLRRATDGEGRFIDKSTLYLGWGEIAPLAWALLDSTQLDQRVLFPAGHPREGEDVRPWVSLMLDLGSRAAIVGPCVGAQFIRSFRIANAEAVQIRWGPWCAGRTLSDLGITVRCGTERDVPTTVCRRRRRQLPSEMVMTCRKKSGHPALG